MRIKRFRFALFLVAAAVFGAAEASAQSVIAGVVTDTTGAVLPGVSVEVRSPALIEQVKTAVSDGQGLYRVVDLRPGTYTVTFTLPGFGTVVRDGITPESNFTAKVDAQLKVGALEETVTVSGAAPVVDVQRAERREVVNREVIDTIPTGRTMTSLARAMPAVVVSGGGAAVTDVGGTDSQSFRGVNAYGGGPEQVRIDGMSVDGGRNDGATLASGPNDAAVEEYVYSVNGLAAAFQGGGVQVNLVPKTGGNSFKGSAVWLYGNHSMQSTNASDAQLKAGLAVPPGIDRVFDRSL